MDFLSLLKKSSINCPHCHVPFELGPDLEHLSKTAGGLLDKLSGVFAGNPFEETSAEIARQFKVSPDEATALLGAALEDEAIINSIYDFIDDE